MAKQYLTVDEIRRCLQEDRRHLQTKVKDLKKKNRRLERLNKRKHLQSFYFGEKI